MINNNSIKLSLVLIVVLFYTCLVSCSNDVSGESYSRSITFTGDYGSRFDTTLGTYTNNGGSAVVTSSQLTFTCPPGYAVPSFISAPTLGTTSPNYICNRQGGCQVQVMSFSGDELTVAPATVTSTNPPVPLADNGSNEGFDQVCIIPDQTPDWSAQ